MKTTLRLSPFKQHVEKWKDCTRCSLHHGRKHVVISRGQVPCDILFIGEAPGKSEDVLGIPFIGPAGKLLDGIIERAIDDLGWIDMNGQPPTVRLAFTNLVGCIPLGDGGEKTSEPDQTDIVTCKPKLLEFYQLSKPKLLVLVGALPGKWVDKIIPHREIKSVQIDHPAYLLRLNVAQQGLAIQRCEVKLRNAMEELS